MTIAEAIAKAEPVIGRSVRLDDDELVQIPKAVLVALTVGAQLYEHTQAID